MLRLLTSFIHSLNVKIFAVAALLGILLVVLVFKAIMIRSRKMKEMERVNLQIEPLGEETPLSFEGPALVATAVPPAARLPSRAGAGGKAPRGERGAADHAELNRVLYEFGDFDPERRKAGEKTIYGYFLSMIKECAALEKEGKTNEASVRLETFFDKLDAIGYPHKFERTKARKRFMTTLSSGWSKLPFLSRWAYIRMMGIVGDGEVRPALYDGIKQGVFEDEAAIALFKTGDKGALPVLLDNISRGRIKGERLMEVNDVVTKLNDPDIIGALIGTLGSVDVRLRLAALRLLEKYSADSASAPKDNDPNDPGLRLKWETWWGAARSGYRPVDRDAEPVVSLGLVTGLGPLPDYGRGSKEYFRKLSEEIGSCCGDLRSLELDRHRRGELALYRLARRMADDYNPEREATAHVMEQYMDALADEVRKICLYQKFVASPERDEFLTWAVKKLDSAGEKEVVFLMKIIGVVGVPDIAPRLKRYAGSWEAEVRDTAFISMGKLGSPEASSYLARLLRGGELSPAESREVIAAMERIGDAEAVQGLIRAVRESPPVIGYDAFLALRRIRGRWGETLSLEEFEQGRDVVAEDYSAWRKEHAKR